MSGLCYGCPHKQSVCFYLADFCIGSAVGWLFLSCCPIFQQPAQSRFSSYICVIASIGTLDKAGQGQALAISKPC